MASDNETVADICKKMEEMPKKMEGIDGNGDLVVLDIPYFRSRILEAYMREIEATAAKCCQLGRLAGYGASEIKHQQEPVGHAAKMREALGDVYGTLKKLQPYALQINDISLRRAFRSRLCRAKNVIDAALAAPGRNLQHTQTKGHTDDDDN